MPIFGDAHGRVKGVVLSTVLRRQNQTLAMAAAAQKHTRCDTATCSNTGTRTLRPREGRKCCSRGPKTFVMADTDAKQYMITRKMMMDRMKKNSSTSIALAMTTNPKACTSVRSWTGSASSSSSSLPTPGVPLPDARARSFATDSCAPTTTVQVPSRQISSELGSSVGCSRLKRLALRRTSDFCSHPAVFSQISIN